LNKIPKIFALSRRLAPSKTHILKDAGITFGMKNKENFILDLKDLLRGVLVALLFSLAFVLLFALIIRWADIGENGIVIGNYVIKFLSLALGILIGFKHHKNGILKGAIVGLTFMLVTFLIFGAMSAFVGVAFNWIDLVALTLGGAILGVIRVNLRTKKA
jgi:putative membrane protein (TIGR04086 family)